MDIRWFLLFGGRPCLFDRFRSRMKTWTNRPVLTLANECDTLAALTLVVGIHLIGVCRPRSRMLSPGPASALCIRAISFQAYRAVYEGREGGPVS